MNDEKEQIDPAQIQSIIDARQAQLDDPVGFAKAQQVAAIEADYAAITQAATAAGLGQDAFDKLAQQREAALAGLEPIPLPVTNKVTVVALGIPSGVVSTALWSAGQYVEPTRDGKPWCTQADAEEYLVLAAQIVMRGMSGIKAKKYALTFDSAKSILTLTLG